MMTLRTDELADKANWLEKGVTDNNRCKLADKLRLNFTHLHTHIHTPVSYTHLTLPTRKNV